MRKIFIPIFVAVLFLGIFGLGNLAFAITDEEVGKMDFSAPNSAGEIKTYSGYRWCTGASMLHPSCDVGKCEKATQVYHFCKDGKHYSFKCKCKDGHHGPPHDWDKCNPDSAMVEDCPDGEGCKTWICDKGDGCIEGSGFCCKCSDWEYKKENCRRGICDQTLGSIEMYITRSCPEDCAKIEDCVDRDECRCGNGKIDGDEKCDPGDPDIGLPERLGGKTCENLGYGAGELHCSSDCLTFDASGCSDPPECGDGVLDPLTENCEIDLDTGHPIFGDIDTCQKVDSRYIGGTLGCTTDCKFNTDLCTTATTPTPSPIGIIKIEPPITATSFEALVGGIVNFVFNIALVLAPLMVIIGAIYLLTSGGDPKKIETGKNIIIYTLIGLAIILLAKGLIAVLEAIIGVK